GGAHGAARLSDDPGGAAVRALAGRAQLAALPARRGHGGDLARLRGLAVAQAAGALRRERGAGADQRGDGGVGELLGGAVRGGAAGDGGLGAAVRQLRDAARAAAGDRLLGARGGGAARARAAAPGAAVDGLRGRPDGAASALARAAADGDDR